MHFTELIGITLNIDFNYKNKTQKESLSTFLWSEDKLNTLFAGVLSIMSEEFFHQELLELNISQDAFRIVTSSFITSDPDIDELLDWISLDIDIQTNSKEYDIIFDFLYSNCYKDVLIDIFKKNIIKYFLKVNLDETISVKIEITEIGGN